MKHYFKKLPVFLYICIALFIYSCAEEKNVVEEQSRIKKVNLSDLPYLQREINKETSKGSFARGDIAYYLDKIIAENIIEITDQQGLKNYTFALNFRELDTLFNLSAKETIDGYSYTLMKYTTPNLDQWIEDIKTTQQSTVVPEIEAEPLDNKIFINSGQGMCIEMNFQCPEGIHPCTNCDPCVYAASQWILTIDIFPCHTIGGGGTDGGDNPIGPTGPTVGVGTTGGSPTGSGPGPGVITMPNVDDEDSGTNGTPCEKLKNLLKNDTIVNPGTPQADTIKRPNLIPKIDSLKPYVNGQNEHGYELEHKNFPNIYYSTLATPGIDNMILGTDAWVYGGIHNHTFNKLSIPSFGDLVWLLACYDHAKPYNQSIVVSVVVVLDPTGIPVSPTVPATNVYALVIDNYVAFNQYVTSTLNCPGCNDIDKDIAVKAVMNKQKSSFGAKGTPAAILEAQFLKLHSNNGFSIYKANSSLTNWSKLNLINGAAIPIPCPN